MMTGDWGDNDLVLHLTAYFPKVLVEGARTARSSRYPFETPIFVVGGWNRLENLTGVRVKEESKRRLLKNLGEKSMSLMKYPATAGKPAMRSMALHANRVILELVPELQLCQVLLYDQEEEEEEEEEEPEAKEEEVVVVEKVVMRKKVVEVKSAAKKKSGGGGGGGGGGGEQKQAAGTGQTKKGRDKQPSAPAAPSTAKSTTKSITKSTTKSTAKNTAKSTTKTTSPPPSAATPATVTPPAAVEFRKKKPLPKAILKKVEARKAKELVDNKKKEENEIKRQKQAELNATRREEQRMEQKKRDDVAMALRLQKNFEKQKKTSAYQSMFNQRQSLPAFTRQAEVVDMIEKHQVVVISGATGCGKSTQVPQFVLDAMLESGRGAEASIVCTQPRR